MKIETTPAQPDVVLYRSVRVIYCGMLQRCENPKNSNYVNYGGRGITVCERWRESFVAFAADMGPRPGPEYSIDRINNDGNYEPSNVRWATRKEQANNRRTREKVSADKGQALVLPIVDKQAKKDRELKRRSDSKRRHGHGGTRLVGDRPRPSSTYRAWQSIRERCYNQNHQHYLIYGGRGIQVCERWRESFDNFLADMGEKPSPMLSIDRIDSNGHYEPSNCRWATPKEQGQNTSRNVNLTFNGETKCLSEWARYLGLEVSTLSRRIREGWDVEKAFLDQLMPAGEAAKMGAARRAEKAMHLEFNGESLSISEWASHFGLNPITLGWRINYGGWSVEDALTTPTKNKLHVIEFQGEFRSLTEWEHHIGLRHGVLCSRLKKGWSIEAALTTPTTTRNKKEGNNV